MNTITDATIIDTLRAVVTEAPDTVYSVPAVMQITDEEGNSSGRCYYVHRDEEGNETAGCLIGVVLNRLGVSLDTLREYENRPANTLVDLLGLNLSFSTGEFLRRAQNAQDRGAPWSTALAFAEGKPVQVMSAW